VGVFWACIGIALALLVTSLRRVKAMAELFAGSEERSQA
jgi:hypothetical protein